MVKDLYAKESVFGGEKEGHKGGGDMVGATTRKMILKATF